MSIGNASGSGNGQLDLPSVYSGYGAVSMRDRIEQRALRGTFDLTSSEFAGVADADIMEGFSEKWYEQYRALMSLKAESLKKKMQRAYTELLESSMYAQVQPNDTGAAGANATNFTPHANLTNNSVLDADPDISADGYDFAPKDIDGLVDGFDPDPPDAFSFNPFELFSGMFDTFGIPVPDFVSGAIEWAWSPLEGPIDSALNGFMDWIGLGGGITPGIPTNEDIDPEDVFQDGTQLKVDFQPVGAGGTGLTGAQASEIRDLLLNDRSVHAQMQTAAELVDQMAKSFAGRQYDDIDGPESMAAFTQGLQVAYTIAPTGSTCTTVPLNLSPLMSSSAINPDLWGTFGAPIIPNIGIFGFEIPLAFGLSFVINISFDFMAYATGNMLNMIRNSILDTAEAFAYSTTSGSAFDSYVARGEYNVTQAGLRQALAGALTFVPGVDLGSIFGSVMDMIADVADIGEVNQVDIKERMFGDSPLVSAPERRELETGGFFSTVEFLRQFNVDSMDYSYYTQSMQREELCNADLLRALATGGEELFMKLIGIAVGAIPPPIGTVIGIAYTAIKMTGIIQNVLKDLINRMIFEDQNSEGGALTTYITRAYAINSEISSEGVDFLENELKPFESDSDRKSPTGMLDFTDFPNSDQLLDGMANTRRFKADQFGASTDVGRSGDTFGFYDDDTDLGDVNEVVVRSKTVSINNITDGVGTVNETDDQTRYIGSNNRIAPRKYDGATALNMDEFTTGFYTGNRQKIKRSDMYSLNATLGTSGDSFSLSKERALNPMFGGRAKLAKVDRNAHDDRLFAAATDGNSQVFGSNGTRENPLTKMLYDHMHLHRDGSNLQQVREYRDVFNMGMMKHVFLSASVNSPSGGGISSNVEVSFDVSGGSSTLQSEAQTVEARNFQNGGQGEATVYLNSYIAFRKRAR